MDRASSPDRRPAPSSSLLYRVTIHEAGARGGANPTRHRDARRVQACAHRQARQDEAGPMRIWILSDLHLEYAPLSALLEIPNADVCVMAGDLCRGPANGVRWLAENIGYAMPCVYVAGNHEFYRGSIVEGLEQGRQATQGFANVHFLENEAVIIGGVRFPRFGVRRQGGHACGHCGPSAVSGVSQARCWPPSRPTATGPAGPTRPWPLSNGVDSCWLCCR